MYENSASSLWTNIYIAVKHNIQYKSGNKKVSLPTWPWSQLVHHINFFTSFSSSLSVLLSFSASLSVLLSFSAPFFLLFFPYTHHTSVKHSYFNRVQRRDTYSKPYYWYRLSCLEHEQNLWFIGLFTPTKHSHLPSLWERTLYMSICMVWFLSLPFSQSLLFKSLSKPCAVWKGGGWGTISDKCSRSFHLTVFKDEKNLTGSDCPVLDMNKFCDSLACAHPQNTPHTCPHCGDERCTRPFASFASYPYPLTNVWCSTLCRKLTV